MSELLDWAGPASRAPPPSSRSAPLPPAFEPRTPGVPFLLKDPPSPLLCQKLTPTPPPTLQVPQESRFQPRTS